jgi:hypothetical protein
VPRIGCCRSDWRLDGALAAKASVAQVREVGIRRQERFFMASRILAGTTGRWKPGV